MPAPVPLYHAVLQHLHAHTRPTRLRVTSLRRLALLVTGLLAARSGVLAPVVAELDALRLTRAATAESLARRLRRTLDDARLDPRTCYAPALRAALDWPAKPRRPRQSLFALGVRRVRRWLHQVAEEALPCSLPALDAPSWQAQLQQHQALRLIFGESIRP
jgi:hypothetical protein